jgi:hypothetical protein
VNIRKEGKRKMIIITYKIFGVRRKASGGRNYGRADARGGSSWQEGAIATIATMAAL